MSRHSNRDWLALAVRTQRHQTHDLAASLRDARERAREAQLRHSAAAAELTAVTQAWRDHRRSLTAPGNLDLAFQQFHAHVQTDTTACERELAAQQRAADSALAAVQASFARFSALDALAARLRRQDERESLRREYLAHNEVWGLRKPTAPEKEAP